MKTANHITVSILLVGLFMAADAQARSHQPVRRGHPTHVIPTPRPHFKSSVFIPIVRPPVVTRHIVTLPPRHTIVMPAPVVIHEPTVTVWISNANGSMNSVVLRRQGLWYVGPRGEHYVTMPTQDQLRPLYGLDCGPVEAEKVSVYITTDNGAMRLITLTRTRDGFLGPKGELYRQMPTEAQLRMVYGR
ncbi:MAG: hypothetical protein IH624_01535 [Phycisphaerae bacterium]|nr:hypothetical protein [Phycisphaerae bacterium]